MAEPAFWFEKPLTEPPPAPTYEELVAQFKALTLPAPSGPREIAVSDQGTLDALLAGVPVVEASLLTNPLGSLLSVPIVIDDTLPPRDVHVREYDGRVSAIWRLADDGRWISLPVVGWPEVNPGS